MRRVLLDHDVDPMGRIMAVDRLDAVGVEGCALVIAEVVDRLGEAFRRGVGRGDELEVRHDHDIALFDDAVGAKVGPGAKPDAGAGILPAQRFLGHAVAQGRDGQRIALERRRDGINRLRVVVAQDGQPRLLRRIGFLDRIGELLARRARETFGQDVIMIRPAFGQ